MKPLFVFLIIVLAISSQGQVVSDTVQRSNSMMQRPTDSAAREINAGKSQSQQAQKIRIIKKDVDYSVFVKLGIGMMCFIALFYASSQTWNPGD
jgi:hypothetical protein